MLARRRAKEKEEAKDNALEDRVPKPQQKGVDCERPLTLGRRVELRPGVNELFVKVFFENGMNQRREPCRQGCIAISDTWSDASVVQTRVMQVQKGVYNPAGHDVFLACLRV